MAEVRVTESGLVYGDRVHRKGDLVAVDDRTARRFVDEGRAAHTVKVRVACDNVIVGRHVLMTGDEHETDGDTAVRLHKEGRAEVIDRHKLPHPEDLGRFVPRTLPRRPTQPDPYAAQPTVKVKVNRPFTAGTTSYVPGTVPGLSLPEEVAVKWIVGGAVSLRDGAALSTRGVEYLNRLKAHGFDGLTRVTY